MKQFTYAIYDQLGIHARPAGLLVKAAKELDITITMYFAAVGVFLAILPIITDTVVVLLDISSETICKSELWPLPSVPARIRMMNKSLEWKSPLVVRNRSYLPGI